MINLILFKVGEEIGDLSGHPDDNLKIALNARISTLEERVWTNFGALLFIFTCVGCAPLADASRPSERRCGRRRCPASRLSPSAACGRIGD